MKLTTKQWAFFLIIALIFALVEFKGLTQAGPGDENVYFYMAKQISEGQMPYRDFFYAHPPLHILALALLIKLFGANFFVLKSTGLLFILTAAFFAYKLALGLFQDRINDKNADLISIISVILFLFSFTTLFTATFSVGIELSAMLMMAGFYLVFTKRYFAGGIFAGLAGLTRFYALVPLSALFIFIFIKKVQEKKVKDFWMMFIGFFMIFGVIIYLLTLIYGNKFLDSAIKYHFLKPSLPGQKLAVYENIIKQNWVLFSSLILFLFAQNKRKLQLFLFVIILYFSFLMILSFNAEFYFILIFPFLALIGAYCLVNLISRIKINYIKYPIMIIISLAFLWNITADILFLEKVGFLGFSSLNPMVSKVSATSPSQQIFGDASIAPLVALKSGRNLALNYIDTNEMTFTSGLKNFYVFADNLDNVNLSYIILRKDYGLHQIEQFRQYTEFRCELDEVYSEPVEGQFLMYKCV